MARVSLKDVRKIYHGDIRAVDDLNLEVNDGELMVVVGPSGCGKSTTLRMIAGLEDVSAGTIWIGDRVVNQIPPQQRDVAMVFQNHALFPQMTVRENLVFGLKLRKINLNQIGGRVAEISQTLGLCELLNRRPNQLSGGEQQRVAVGRSIVRQPALFLFDEPLSNLDARTRVRMRVEISQLQRKLGQTMIYVTHDQTEAMTMGDRIAVMSEGTIEQVATPEELYDRPASMFVAEFIGTHPMNFFRGKLVTEDGQITFDGDAIKLRLPESWKKSAHSHLNQPVFVGLRPHAISPDLLARPNVIEIEATIELTEPLGAETILHLAREECSFICQVRRSRRYHVGQKITVGCDMERAHLFDANTGQVIALND